MWNIRISGATVILMGLFFDWALWILAIVYRANIFALCFPVTAAGGNEA